MLSALHKAGARVATRTTASRVISRGFAKQIKFGVEGRSAMLRGVDLLADAVQVRLTSQKGCISLIWIPLATKTLYSNYGGM